VATFADLLDPGDRERLDLLAHPRDVQDLAEAARQAAQESDGAGRVAWLCVTVALSGSGSPDEAKAILTGMLEDGKIKATALACLTALCSEGTGA
jgi:hypothetical protein